MGCVRHVFMILCKIVYFWKNAFLQYEQYEYDVMYDISAILYSKQ